MAAGLLAAGVAIGVAGTSLAARARRRRRSRNGRQAEEAVAALLRGRGGRARLTREGVVDVATPRMLVQVKSTSTRRGAAMAPPISSSEVRDLRERARRERKAPVVVHVIDGSSAAFLDLDRDGWIDPRDRRRVFDEPVLVPLPRRDDDDR